MLAADPGRLRQLAVCALAARARLVSEGAVRARSWGAPSGGGFLWRGYEVTPEVLARVGRTVAPVRCGIGEEVPDGRRVEQPRGELVVDVLRRHDRGAERVLLGTPRGQPLCVVQPRTTEQVAAVLRLATAAKRAVIPVGGGSGLMGGAASIVPGIVLDLRQLNDIHIRPADRMADVGAGATVAAVILVAVALTVGTDSAIGKMTAALEIARSAREAGLSPEFVPTGQTGIIIAGWGVCVDAVVCGGEPVFVSAVDCEHMRTVGFLCTSSSYATEQPDREPATAMIRQVVAALGVGDLTLDNRVQDGAEGGQLVQTHLGESRPGGRAAAWRSTAGTSASPTCSGTAGSYGLR